MGGSHQVGRHNDRLSATCACNWRKDVALQMSAVDVAKRHRAPVCYFLKDHSWSGWSCFRVGQSFERPQPTKIGKTDMLRTVFAIGIAGLIFAGGSGPTHAAPILPLPAAASGFDNLTDVQWGRRCWRDRWGRVHCRSARHCWRDRWGNRRGRW
jgi:hypothetical protein